MENQNGNSNVILVLGNLQLTVNKEHLTKKSHYFATLLSENYIDHYQEEHLLNYNIPISVLKDYISWIDDEYFSVKFDFECKRSLERFCYNNNSYEDLIKLLYVSVLFSTDQLTKEIIIIIEKTLIKPKFLIDIWMVAVDLALHMLQNIAFVACLDNFDKLPIDELIQLESHYLQKLFNSPNRLFMEEYMRDILFTWVKTNNVEKLPVELSILIKNKKPRILHLAIDFDIPHANQINEIRVYCWDGSNFYKHSTLPYPREICDVLREMQECRKLFEGSFTGIACLAEMEFIHRRYNLYFGGGAYYPTEMLNEKIWRYSLVSKKWFVETRMPVPRKYMLTVCIKNKLYFIGGIEFHEKYSSDVDIYDIEEGIWFKGTSAPEKFLSMASYYVTKNKLIIMQKSEFQFLIFIYYANMDIWKIFNLPYESDGKSIINISPILIGLSSMLSPLVLVLDTVHTRNLSTSNNFIKLVITHIIYVPNNTKCEENGNYTCEVKLSRPGSQCELHPNGVTHLKQKYSVSAKYLSKYNSFWEPFIYPSEKSEVVYEHTSYHHFTNYHVHTFVIPEPVKWKRDWLFEQPLQFFPIMDPADLYSA